MAVTGKEAGGHLRQAICSMVGLRRRQHIMPPSKETANKPRNYFLHLSAKGCKVIPKALVLHPTTGPLSTNTENLELSQEWLDYHNDSQEHILGWL